MTDILDLEGWTPTNKHTCASCGGVYEGTELYLTRMGPLFEDEPDINLVVMCGHCKVRFHTERANAHHSASTP